MNSNFIRYATGTVFAIQLSKAQVRALVGMSVSPDRVVSYMNLAHHHTPDSLVRKGLVEYKDKELVLTEPGRLVLKLLDQAGLVPKGRHRVNMKSIVEEVSNDS